MNITTSKVTFKRLEPGDKKFTMTDGVKIAHRAAIEFGNDCPASIIFEISNAISRGWITPVAYIREEEYVWETLKD
jgi:hypothetical protein